LRMCLLLEDEEPGVEGVCSPGAGCLITQA
jgi:hypothetical protein